MQVICILKLGLILTRRAENSAHWPRIKSNVKSIEPLASGIGGSD